MQDYRNARYGSKQSITINQCCFNLQQFTSIERIKFLHGTLGFLALSTLKRAIQAGYLDSFPDLTLHNISKLSLSDITILGHLDTKRKNLQSTKLKSPVDE